MVYHQNVNASESVRVESGDSSCRLHHSPANRLNVKIGPKVEAPVVSSPASQIQPTCTSHTPTPYRQCAFNCFPVIIAALVADSFSHKNWNKSPASRPARDRKRHRHATSAAQRVNNPFASRLIGRKDCHPPTLAIVGPETASIGSSKPPPASDRQNVLFRVTFGQDRTSGACLAGFQLGAQTHKAKCATVGP